MTSITDDGATVTAVASSEEALAALQWERPDVLLSDLAIPGRGDDWLIGQVRALTPERGGAIPAVALHCARTPRERPAHGVAYHVEKPVGVVSWSCLWRSWR